MKKIRKIIEIQEDLCDGCGKCVISCAEGAIKIQDGKARLLADWLCDGLGACIGECPTGALRIVEREAEEFDAEAAHEFMKIRKQEEDTGGFKCPSVRFGEILSELSGSCDSCNRPKNLVNESNSLPNWPVKINLIPPNAPFLRDSNILIAADCVSPTCPSFRNSILKDRILLIGCPKFGDQDLYISRLCEIFLQNEISSLTLAVMEVPCCFSFDYIIKKAMERAGKEILINRLVISIRGDIK